jgi:hypothetical protein
MTLQFEGRLLLLNKCRKSRYGRGEISVECHLHTTEATGADALPVTSLSPRAVRKIAFRS